MRPDCPECGEPLAKPFSSCKCGWKSVPARRDGNPYRHGVKVGDHWVNKGCAWNDHGRTCEDYGPLSLGTNGEGPWYCRKHFAELMRWPSPDAKPVTVDGEVVGKLIEKIKTRLPPRREPGEDAEEAA